MPTNDSITAVRCSADRAGRAAGTGAAARRRDRQAVQQKYDRVKDFTADFTHTYEGGVLKKKSTERGTVQIKKPGRMRWEYTAPEKKTFVSDGRRSTRTSPPTSR
jgi:outer membrane lipoprotein carrier protein